MGKRKHQDTEEKIKRKIRKLEQKLDKKKHYRRIFIESSDEELNDDSTNINTSQPAATYANFEQMSDSASSSPPLHTRCNVELSCAALPSPIPVLEDPYTNPTPGTSAAKDVTDHGSVELAEDILQLLGDAPRPEKELGPPVHKDIASRLQEILAKGLSKEVKDKLLEEYVIPSNCDLLTAPILNPEAKAALPDIKLKRDSSLLNKQQQIGIAISALTAGMELIISDETSKQKMLKPISDACRILCNLHYADTKLRRDFVINSINNKLKETLIDTTRDKYLFGENVTEKLKAIKTIQQSGESLKTIPKPTFYKNYPNAKTSNNNKNNLNYKRQPRNYNNKRSNEAAPARQAPRHPRSANSDYKPRTRSPPRKTRRR